MSDNDSFSRLGLLRPGRYHYDIPPFEGRKRTFRRSLDIIVDSSVGMGSYSALFRLLIIGPKGAVQFVLLWPYRIKDDNVALQGPFPVDIGLHSPRSLYDGQEVDEEYCPALEGRCYYSSSDLPAQKAFDTFLKLGEEALWRFLEKEYEKAFG